MPLRMVAPNDVQARYSLETQEVRALRWDVACHSRQGKQNELALPLAVAYEFGFSSMPLVILFMDGKEDNDAQLLRKETAGARA